MKRVVPVDFHGRLSAVCEDKAPERSTVFSWVRSFDSGKATAQAAVLNLHNTTPTEWFREAIRKLPKRLQLCIT